MIFFDQYLTLLDLLLILIVAPIMLDQHQPNYYFSCYVYHRTADNVNNDIDGYGDFGADNINNNYQDNDMMLMEGDMQQQGMMEFPESPRERGEGHGEGEHKFSSDASPLPSKLKGLKQQQHVAVQKTAISEVSAFTFI